MLNRLTTLACAGLVFASGVSATMAHDGASTHPPAGHLDSRSLPVCAEPGVLADITKKEGLQRQAPYQHPVDVTGYDHVRQTRHIGAMGPGLRERRWCQARAHLAAGGTRTVYYVIEGTAAFAGVSYGVESCMAGRDLWNVHGGDCSALRNW